MSESEYPVAMSIEELKRKAVKIAAASSTKFQRVIVQTNVSYERYGMETVMASGTSMQMRDVSEDEEEPYKRRMSLKAGEWSTLDLGWVSDNVGCVSLQYKYDLQVGPVSTAPSPAPMIIGIKHGQDVVPVFELQPGDVIPLVYLNASAMRVRSDVDAYLHIIAMPK